MKTYPIRMRPDMAAAIERGDKTETRRTNLKWLKVKKGDRLRVLQRGLLLEATADARSEPLQSITEAGARAEGMQASKVVEYNDGPPVYLDSFREVWRQIHGVDNPEAFDSNPEVAVIEFGLIGGPKSTATAPNSQ